jgi:hypothetical protein
MTAETYGPALGSTITINAPKRSCHGKQGTVMSLHLATNEATVQLRGGTQVIVPWSAESDTSYVHGTWARFSRDKCRCADCYIAMARYLNEHPDDHGTDMKYRRGCHCDSCKAAHAEIRRIYRANRRG